MRRTRRSSFPWTSSSGRTRAALVFDVESCSFKLGSSQPLSLLSSSSVLTITGGQRHEKTFDFTKTKKGSWRAFALPGVKSSNVGWRSQLVLGKTSWRVRELGKLRPDCSNSSPGSDFFTSRRSSMSASTRSSKNLYTQCLFSCLFPFSVPKWKIAQPTGSYFLYWICLKISFGWLQIVFLIDIKTLRRIS